jgi:hypothetical protein
MNNAVQRERPHCGAHESHFHIRGGGFVTGAAAGVWMRALFPSRQLRDARNDASNPILRSEPRRPPLDERSKIRAGSEPDGQAGSAGMVTGIAGSSMRRATLNADGGSLWMPANLNHATMPMDQIIAALDN